MEALKEVFPVILYGLLIILVIVLIILAIKMIGTLKKVDRVVDDVNEKAKSLNGVFSIIDHTTDALSGFGDKIVNLVTSGINALLSIKKKKKEEEEDKNEEE